MERGRPDRRVRRRDGEVRQHKVKGYFLGFDADGKPAPAAMIGGEKHVLVAQANADRLQRFQWTHLAGVIDTAAGTMTIYVDGRAAGSADVPKDKPIDLAAGQPVVIGQGPPMATAWPVGKTFGQFQYSVEGSRRTSIARRSTRRSLWKTGAQIRLLRLR